jgi:YesN/AraC family two-component response regulator
MALLVISESGSEELENALSKIGAEVTSCPLKETHVRLDSKPIKLILLDSGLNVKKGLSLLKELKARRPEVSVIFITGVSSEDVILEAFRTGAKDYFKKPVNVFQLKETVKNILQLRRNASHEKRVHYQVTANKAVLPSLKQATTGIPANLLRAVSHLEENVSGPMSLEKLSGEAGMSKHHFCRVFKKHLGMSPMHFLTMLRIERSKELFKTSSQSVSAIAGEVGFNDLSSFIKHFKKITGATPTAFKKSLKKKEPANLRLF